MFRAVLTYLLALMLLVGPMLCCCTAAQLGHGRDTHSAAIAPTGSAKSIRKSCCGKQEPPESGPAAPGQLPHHPAKCPCKEGPAKLNAVPTVPTTSVDTYAFTFFLSDLVQFDFPVTIDAAASAVQIVRSDAHRGSGLSTADLLYAHHKLRC